MPEYDLIHARAQMLYRRVVESEAAVVDHYWANYCRQWDSPAPHAHRRSTVYYPNLGDDTDDPRPAPAPTSAARTRLVTSARRAIRRSATA